DARSRAPARPACRLLRADEWDHRTVRRQRGEVHRRCRGGGSDSAGRPHTDLSEVLLRSGKLDQAVAALEQAVTRYERKGNLVSTRSAQARLAEISAEGGTS